MSQRAERFQALEFYDIIVTIPGLTTWERYSSVRHMTSYIKFTVHMWQRFLVM